LKSAPADDGAAEFMTASERILDYE
jgi:hypothetical protein